MHLQSRPSEHPPVRGENVKTLRLGGIIGCKDKISSWHLNEFLDGSNIDNVEDKPTVILYTYYINRDAGTPQNTFNNQNNQNQPKTM